MTLEMIPHLRPELPDTDGAASLAAAIDATVADLAGEAVTVVLNDPQRGTRSSAVLGRLAGALESMRALIATGAHRFPAGRREAFQAGLGRRFDEVAWHDCRSDELVDIGGWRGHPWLLDESRAVLAIGSCEPHYFAGITGAHKTLTIGCARFADIEANHAGALSPEARPCRLAGNPVHDGVAAMVRSLSARRPVRAINLLQVGDEIISAAAGEPLAALAALAQAVEKTYVCRLERPAEALVLKVDGVLGRSFYQADKAVKNSEWAVRDGGCIVLAADCPDGVGQDAFMDLLREHETYDRALATVEARGYRLGDHKALKLRYLTDRRRVRVFVVSDGLSSGDAEILGFAKADTIARALPAAGVASSANVYYISDAANTCVVTA